MDYIEDFIIEDKDGSLNRFSAVLKERHRMKMPIVTKQDLDNGSWPNGSPAGDLFLEWVKDAQSVTIVLKDNHFDPIRDLGMSGFHLGLGSNRWKVTPPKKPTPKKEAPEVPVMSLRERKKELNRIKKLRARNLRSKRTKPQPDSDVE